MLTKYKLQIGIGLVGLILVGIGVFAVRQLAEKPTIEILPEEGTVEGTTIFVDLAGAVENPGVYELSKEARINDLLVRAGGLSAEADRDWVSKKINLAQKLSDGAKIYVPERSGDLSKPAEVGEGGRSSQIAGASAGVMSKININTASAAQLDTLWGIGEKRAQSIVTNRPYQTIEELKTKASIPKNVFERIKAQVTVY